MSDFIITAALTFIAFVMGVGYGVKHEQRKP